VADSGEKALQLLTRKKYTLVVTDLMMKQVDGLGLLEYVKRVSPNTEVILLTAYGKVDTAVEAMKLGAYDYLTKPFDPHKLDVSVKRAFEHQKLLHELSGLKEILRLYDATKTLSTIRDEKELLQALVKYACEITDSTGASIYTLATGEKELEITATHGSRHGILLGKRIPVDRDRIGRLDTNNLKSMDTLDVRRFFQLESVPGYGDIVASLSVPVFFKDRLLAIMNLCRTGDKPPYGNEELRLITIFTAQAGYAIENSRLFQSLSVQSSKDMMGTLKDTCEKIMSHPSAKELPETEKKKLRDLMEHCQRISQS
jgi:CheY-like chemotaxis protein